MAAIASKAKAPSADVLAAARPIVRALTPAGRTNRRESEDELRHRFAEDGAEIDKKYFNAALAVLEENGHAGGYDAGRLPGLPYRIVRPLARMSERVDDSLDGPSPPTETPSK
jgi:hypothetical protein